LAKTQGDVDAASTSFLYGTAGMTVIRRALLGLLPCGNRSRRPNLPPCMVTPSGRALQTRVEMISTPFRL